MDSSQHRHLPRLDREWYRGRAFIHWTGATVDRTTGWLNTEFRARWLLVLLHTCSRYELACPTYTIMPDHFHMLWLGLDAQGSDQRLAIEFFMKHTRALLRGAHWQRQTHDRVLRESERERDAFTHAAEYILDNPVRARLVTHRRDWPYAGSCVPGYPNLNTHEEGYWELFWRLYSQLADRRSTRSCSQPPTEL